MAVGNVPIFEALKSKMQWHQARQSLLAQNVANAETPGYRGSDLSEFQFAEVLKTASTASVTTVATSSKHFSVGNTGSDSFGPRREGAFEVTPEGNSVVLEEQMMKVAANQMEYQTATSLYGRSMRLLRTALGRQ